MERERIEKHEELDGLESSPGLEIALDKILKGERGTEVNYDPLADI